MDFVKQCPNTYESRISRSRINNCSTLDSYHCLKTEYNGLREICISPIWIKGDMCPIYIRGGKIGASKCIVQPQLECPTIVYKSSDVFNYTGCLPIIRENATTKNTHQDMCNSTFTCINDAGKNLQAAYFAVPALLLFLMLIGKIVLWKSDDTQIDQPEIVTPSFRNEKPNKKSGTGETKISLNIKGVIRGSAGEKESAEKTKDNAKTSNTEEESKLLLNVDDSAKENDEKIKIDTPDNDHISKEVTHLLDENLTKDNDHISEEVTHLVDEKLTKENPNSKPSTKESKRSSSKFKLPFPKRSSEKHKQENNKPSKEGIKRLENEMTPKTGAFRKTKKQNNKPTKENIKLSDNENTSKADAFEKTDQSKLMVQFKEDMANLLLKKDVLILACPQNNENIDLGMEIAMISAKVSVVMVFVCPRIALLLNAV
uniref:Uncharacterized protein n=1 Tax=Magallana gigas TaxID=29159 RepID=A0A8W8KJ61_MAGGI